MDGRCGAKTRRREHAAAVVCALSLFVALVAGSALRPHYTANSLPEPRARAHSVSDVQIDHGFAHPRSATPALTYLVNGSRVHPAPISRKPFRYVWMTKDLPSNWDPPSPQAGWSVLPTAFGEAQFQARGAPGGASTADPPQRHTSSLFAIIRC